MKAYRVIGIVMAAGLRAQSPDCTVNVNVEAGPTPVGILFDTKVLGGFQRHCDQGLMKAVWSEHDHESAKRQAFPFTPAQASTVYRFSTAKYSVLMGVRFPAPYEGKRLVAYRSADSGKEDCLSAEIGTSGCIEAFVGALAVVTFTITRTSDHKSANTSIREVVSVANQSPGLPARAPFSMTVKLVNGVGSDWQVFGYDESPLPPEKRAQEREMARAAWRRYCQELFLDQDRKPFAVVWWHHATTGIRILRVDTNGSEAISSH